ncbi:hypothetical protein B0H14DRAFT_2631944 [Mycena olivaceomarginata]|nr:hypothetical protein B0H14DRAFT_2631944 [Mycena olivaceomarginata]
MHSHLVPLRLYVQPPSLIEVTDSSSGVSYVYVTTDYYMGYSTVDPTENLHTVSIKIPCNPNVETWWASMSHCYAWMGTTDPSTWPHPFSHAMWGQRDFAAAVLLPHAAAAAAALQEQSAAVEPAAHVELLYTTRHSVAVLQHQNTSKHCAAVVGSTLQQQSWHFAVAVGLFQRQSTACCSSMATLGGHDSTAM